MADTNYVSIFDLDGTSISVKDTEARSSITTLTTDVGSLTTRVSAVEALSRLTLSYSAANETLTFTSGTH